jgi:hypothetical protein
MRNQIETLIKEAEIELEKATLEVAQGTAEDNVAVVYWATRIQTLQQVIQMIDEDNNQTIH